jgi:putative transposase
VNYNLKEKLKNLTILVYYLNRIFLLYRIYKCNNDRFCGEESVAEKSYKYRIYPNKKQRELIQKTFGCARFVYNYYLNKKKELYENNKKQISLGECRKDLTALKQELSWLKEPDKCALQNSLIDLDFGFKMFINKNNGYPKFKSKKNNYKSYRTNYTYNNIRFENNHIRLTKIGLVKIKEKRIVSGRILNATISQDPNGYYYCSVCCTDINYEQHSKTGYNVGVDLGIIDFAILSDGIKVDNPHFYERSEIKISKLQRELSRKTIGSNRQKKARVKLAKAYKKVTNQRIDFLQKLSTTIVNNYDIVCIEDLDVQKMKETHVTLRNKRVGDVSWSMFRQMLTYKCHWHEKKLVVIDRYYPSSQICHCCGHNDGKKSENVRAWICPKCHSELDRDVNAAINILGEGLKQLNV